MLVIGEVEAARGPGALDRSYQRRLLCLCPCDPPSQRLGVGQQRVAHLTILPIHAHFQSAGTRIAAPADGTVTWMDLPLAGCTTVSLSIMAGSLL